ncbi:MAG: hypothetical protein U0166_03310 [Acidobacteriota bacterium]
MAFPSRQRYHFPLMILLASAQLRGQSFWRPLPRPDWPGMVQSADHMAYVPDSGRLLLFESAEGLSWEWDGVSWRSSVAAPAAYQGRGLAGLAYDSARKRLVVFGGTDNVSLYNDTWEFDGAAWSQGPPAPAGLTPRFSHALAYDALRATVVLFGGVDNAANLRQTWEYDGSSWTQGPDGPAARNSHAMAFDSVRNVTVVVGGFDGGAAHADTWEFDGTTWSSGPAAPAPRANAGMAFDSTRDALVLFGGMDATGPTNDTFIYDGSWTLGPAAPPALSARYRCPVGFDEARSKVIVYGGLDVDDRPVADTWELSGSAWVRSSAGYSYPLERTGHQMAFDVARGRLVVFGGLTTENDTWEFDGTSWTPGAAPPPALEGRYFGAMAYDPARAVIVLFGGVSTETFGVLDDVWEYDGSAWVQKPSVPPTLGPRSRHGMAADTTRGVIVMFGGFDGTANRNDTWEYDGIGWSPGPAAPAALTPRRPYMAMSFDPSRGRTVLFGGLAAAGPTNDTWEYDGAAWSPGPVAPAGLTPRYGAALAFDATRGVLVLTGGTDGTATNRETWELGATWARGPDMPAAREFHTLAFDPSRGRLLALEGRRGLGLYLDFYEYCATCQPGDVDVIAGEGLGPPNPNRARVFRPDGTPTAVDFQAYGAGKWGLNVACGEIDGAGDEEILTGPGPGTVFGPQVRAFTRTGTSIAKVNFFAYATLRYGVGVGAGDVDGDTHDEILSGAGPGAVFGPHVRGFDYDGATLRAIAKISFFAYGTLKFGVNTRAGDLDGDGFAELLTAPGPGPSFASQLRGFDYDGALLTPIAKINFNAFTTPGYGATIATGAVDADPFAEIVAAPGPGPSSTYPARFRGYDYGGVAITALPGYDVVAFPSDYGGRSGLGDLTGDDVDELLAGSGPDSGADSLVRPFAYDGLAMAPNPGQFLPFGVDTYGVSIASGRLGY